MPTREHTPRQSPPRHPALPCAPTTQRAAHMNAGHLRLGTPKSGRRFPAPPTPTPLAHTEE